jgi:hypothetical protein
LDYSSLKSDQFRNSPSLKQGSIKNYNIKKEAMTKMSTFLNSKNARYTRYDIEKESGYNTTEAGKELLGENSSTMFDRAPSG